jgi:membrane-associated phospholipid phosphatase
MHRRQLLLFFLIAVVLTFVGIFLLDQPVAAFADRAGGRQSPVFQQGTHWLEVASGYPIPNIGRFFLAYLLLGGAAILFLARSTRYLGWIFLFIGSTHLVNRLLAGTLKNVFNRLRPFEVIEAGHWDWHFFGDRGSSFPSGHSAHFWSLFLPLAFLFPRYRLLFFIVPVFITIARVGVNDHWCSDVIASAGLAALITLLFAWLYRIKAPQAGNGRIAAGGENDGV